MAMSKRKIAFLHTSPAAIGPLVQFYGEAAPELQVTNLLEDGILGLLAAREYEQARRRFTDMTRAAQAAYGAELALITCSSVTRGILDELRGQFELPILKIDGPMTRRAVETGKRVGVAVTFPPTLGPTSDLLRGAAEEAGREIEIVTESEPEAYRALLSNDLATHDRLLVGVIEKLQAQGVDVIVLAQVSMARILPQLDSPPLAGRVRVPVLSSLNTSLEAVRAALAAR
jgi:aspartate/glutamate racemase